MSTKAHVHGVNRNNNNIIIVTKLTLVLVNLIILEKQHF